MTQDLYYIESGYLTPDSGYYVYTADAEAALVGSSTVSCVVTNLKGTSINLTSQFTQTITIGVIKEAVSNLVASSSVTATISHIEGADLFAMSNAALSAEVSRVRDNNIATSSVFTVAIDAARVRYVSSEEDAAFSIAIDNLRVRFNEAAVDAAFSLAVDVVKLKKADADLLVYSTSVINSTRLKFFDSSLSSNSSLTAELTVVPGGVVVEASGDWYATVSVDAKATRKANIIDVDTFAAFTTNITADKFAGLSSNFEVVAFITNCTINPIRGFDSAQAATFTQVSQVNEIVQLDSSLNSTANLTSTVLRIQSSSIIMNGAFAPVMTVNAVRNTFAVLDSTATVNANVAKIVNGVASLSTAVTQTTAGMQIKNLPAALSSQFSQVATVRRQGERPRLLTSTGGTVSFSSTNKIVGTHSLSLDSIDASVAYEATNQYLIGAGEDFVIETFVRPTASSTTRTPNTIVERLGVSSFWRLELTTARRFRFVCQAQPGDAPTITGSTTASLNTWYYISIRKVGTTITMSQATLSGTWSSVTSIGSVNATGLNTTGQLGTAGTIRFGDPSNNFAGQIDEFYFGRGTNTIYQFATAGTPNRIDAGKEPTTQILLHFDNSYVDDISGTTRAAAALAASASTTTSAVVNKSLSSALTSQASITLTALRIKPLGATISANGFVTAAIGRIRPFVDIEVTTFTLSAVIGVIKPNAAALASTASVVSIITKTIGPIESNQSASVNLSAVTNVARGLTADLHADGFVTAAFGRIRPFVDIEVATFTLSAQVEAGKLAQADLTATSTVAAVITKQIGAITADLTSTSTLAANVTIQSGTVANLQVTAQVNSTPNRLRDANVALVATANLTATESITKEGIVLEVSSGTLTADVTKIHQLAAGLTAFATELVVLASIERGIIECNVAATLDANINVIAATPAALNSNASLSSTALRIKQGQADLQVNAFELLYSETSKVASAELIATTTIISSANRSASLVANATVISVMTVGVSAVRTGTATLQTTSQLINANTIVKQATATLTSNSQLTVRAIKLLQGQANLSVGAFELVMGTVIDLNNSEIYIVPKEIRSWTIVRETNQWLVAQEIRSWTIAPESNEWIVSPEDETHIIN